MFGVLQLTTTGATSSVLAFNQSTKSSPIGKTGEEELKPLSIAQMNYVGSLERLLSSWNKK